MNLVGLFIKLLTILCSGGDNQQQQQQQQGAWNQGPPQGYPGKQQQQQHQYPPQQQQQQYHGQKPSGPLQPGTAHIGPNHGQSLEQINKTNEYYVGLRNDAIQQGNLMAQCFEKSKAAYQNGDGGRAKELSEEGRRHQRKRDELNRKAADWIFIENNRDSAFDEVDLHGLFVKEALERTEQAIADAKRKGIDPLKVIVGKGLHSQNHVAKIKPAIQDLMRRENLAAELDLHNAGVLLVHFGGGGGGGSRGIQDASWADEMERRTEGEGCVVM